MLAVTNSGTSPRQPQVLTSDRFIYDEQNAPFLNETVAEYRTRLNSVDIDDDDTIFVSIATYRDDACPGTIQTMMTAASRPDRVFVGLVDQTNLDDPHTDDIQCHARLPDDIRKRVRLVRMRHVNARGPTHARHIASKLWDGERFFLMIDAHSTFRDGWDRILIDNIRQLPNPSKAVISHVINRVAVHARTPSITVRCSIHLETLGNSTRTRPSPGSVKQRTTSSPHLACSSWLR